MGSKPTVVPAGGIPILMGRAIVFLAVDRLRGDGLRPGVDRRRERRRVR